jgi:regulator of protease activity HflC (stomatin/prohibitin superfamily)
MYQKIHVRKDERAVLFVKGDLTEVLRAGQHRVFDPLGRTHAVHFSLAEPRFNHPIAQYLQFSTDAQDRALLEREFLAVQVGASEVGLRYENGVLVEVMAPNTRALYFKGYIDVQVDLRNLETQFALDLKLAKEVLSAPKRVAGADLVMAVQVPQYHVALLYVDGKVEALLLPGVHAYFRVGRDLRTELVDTRLQVLDVAGQEILTRDKVALRVNLVAGYRLTDVLVAFAKHAKPVDFLYKELQFGLRAAVGTRTLDELLEDKGAIDQAVAAHVKGRVAGMGLELDSVGVKDIILPGDMKAILTRVVEAEKAAQANVIRRREETAATRSLLNTAKVMEDNPTALRLKELETLEKVTEKIDKISVFGGLDGVLKDLVKIRP